MRHIQVVTTHATLQQASATQVNKEEMQLKHFRYIDPKELGHDSIPGKSAVVIMA